MLKRQHRQIGFVLLLVYFLVTSSFALLVFLVPQSRDFWRDMKETVKYDAKQESAPQKTVTPNTLADELTVFLENRWIEKYEASQERFRFDETTSIEELAQLVNPIQKEFLNGIQFRPQNQPITNLNEDPIGEFPGYNLQSVHFKSANGLTVEGILSVPIQGTGPYPILIIPNGMGSSANEIFGLTRTDYHFEVGRKFANEYIVFAVNIPPTTNDWPEAVASSDRNFYLSNSAGLNWWYYQMVDKVSGAIDYLENRTEGDIQRIAVYGISLGGATTIISSLCDRRISVTIPSGTNVFTPTDTQLLKNRRFSYPHYYQYNVVQRPELFQLLYTLFPNPIIIELNRRDTTGVFEGALESAKQVKHYYELRGAGDRVHIVTFDDNTKTTNGHHMEITQVKDILDELFFAQGP